MERADEELVSRVVMEWIFASPSFLNLELTAEAAMTLLGSLQLTLRHPDTGGRARELILQIAETVETQLAALGPATRELCRLGWNGSNGSEAA